MVVWNVTPALHTPLMSVTNAISSIIVIGALVQISPYVVNIGADLVRPSGWIRALAIVAITLTTINMFGGFANDSSFLLQRTDSAARLGNPKAPAAVMAEIDGTRSGAQMALWGTEALHWNLRWVLGYTGTSDVLLALDRGEADMASTNSLVSVDALLASGKIGILAQTGLRSAGRLQRSTLAPQAPTLAELVDGKLTGQALAAFTEWQNETQLGKWYALPPGTPAEIVATYRTAFTAACADPEFLAAAAKLLRPDFKPVTTADLDGIVGIMVGTAPEILDLMLGLRKKYGL